MTQQWRPGMIRPNVWDAPVPQVSFEEPAYVDEPTGQSEDDEDEEPEPAPRPPENVGDVDIVIPRPPPAPEVFPDRVALNEPRVPPKSTTKEQRQRLMEQRRRQSHAAATASTGVLSHPTPTVVPVDEA